MFGLAAACFADLNEEGFESYQEGELQNQQRWSPEAMDGVRGENIAAKERMEIRRDPTTKKQYLVWKAGFGGEGQTRAVKTFPPTTGSKVKVAFDLIPGANDLGGRFYFDQKSGVQVHATALQFLQGTVRVLETGKKDATNTGIEFKPDVWNHFELRLDFEKHKVEVLADRKSLGSYELNPDATWLDQINFFAGGMAFETALDNLIIESVDVFEVQSPKVK